MSIINDALKKLQTQLSHAQDGKAGLQSPDQSAQLTAAQHTGFEPAPSLRSSPKGSQLTAEEKNNGSHLVIVLGLLCLLTALAAPIVNKQSVIGMLLSKIPKRTTTVPVIHQQTPPAQTVPAVKAAPAVQTAPAVQEKQQPIQQMVKNLTTPKTKPQLNTSNRIIINGIMTRGEDNLALIDGQIYEVGEEVDGVKILNITPKGVTVLDNGIERFIKVMGQ